MNLYIPLVVLIILASGTRDIEARTINYTGIVIGGWSVSDEEANINLDDVITGSFGYEGSLLPAETNGRVKFNLTNIQENYVTAMHPEFTFDTRNQSLSQSGQILTGPTEHPFTGQDTTYGGTTIDPNTGETGGMSVYHHNYGDIVHLWDPLDPPPPYLATYAQHGIFVRLDDAQMEIVWDPPTGEGYNVRILIGSTEVVPEPNIIISPTTYDFGNVDIDNTSTPQTFTISNIGDVDLTIGTITLTGTDATEFAIQNDYCSAQIIAPAGDCTIDAVFVPTLDVAKSASLSIPSDAPDTPTLDTPLSGTGIGPMPDLIGQAQTFYTGNFGKDILVELQIENNGDDNAGSFNVLFILWDGINVVPLDLKFIASGLLVGETTTIVSFHNSLESLSGKFIITLIDFNETVLESNEANNMNIFSIP